MHCAERSAASARTSNRSHWAAPIIIAILLAACTAGRGQNPGFEATVPLDSDHALTYSSSGSAGTLTEPVVEPMATQVVLEVQINGGTVRLEDANGRQVTVLRATPDYRARR